MEIGADLIKLMQIFAETAVQDASVILFGILRMKTS